MSDRLTPSGVTQAGWEFVVDGHASGFRPVFCHQCEAAGECQARTPCEGSAMSLERAGEARKSHYERSWETVRHDIFLKVDDALRQRILKRVGKTAGDVRIEQAEWDFGFCDTCSWPEDGLAVHVDGEQVWPNPDVLARLGGNQIGDDAAQYSDGAVRVTQYSLFYDWLLGATPEELAEIEAKAWEGDDDEGE